MAGGTLGLGLMVGSQIFQGFAENSALRADAAVDMENARRAEMNGAFEEEAIRRRSRALAGDAIAATGANGVAVNAGSALDLMEQSAVNAEYDVLSRRFSASSEAASLRMAASQKKAAGRSALFGGVMRAGAAALTGIGDMKNQAAYQDALAKARANQLHPGGQTLPIPTQVTGMGGGTRRHY